MVCRVWRQTPETTGNPERVTMFQSGAVCEPLKGVEFGYGAVPFRGMKRGVSWYATYSFEERERAGSV